MNFSPCASEEYDYWHSWLKTQEFAEMPDYLRLDRSLSRWALIDNTKNKHVYGYTGKLLIQKTFFCSIKNGILHSNDIPACIEKGRSVTFVNNGRIHRVDGPAKLFRNGGHQWFYHDSFYARFENYLNDNKELSEEKKLNLVLKYG